LVEDEIVQVSDDFDHGARPSQQVISSMKNEIKVPTEELNAAEIWAMIASNMRHLRYE